MSSTTTPRFNTQNVARTVRPAEVTRILRMVRPSFRSRGGDVELVGVKDRDVVIRMTGARAGGEIDFGADAGALERIVRSRVPQIHDLRVV